MITLAGVEHCFMYIVQNDVVDTVIGPPDYIEQVFNESSGLSSWLASLTQSRAKSSYSFAVPEDMGRLPQSSIRRIHNGFSLYRVPGQKRLPVRWPKASDVAAGARIVHKTWD